MIMKKSEDLEKIKAYQAFARSISNGGYTQNEELFIKYKQAIGEDKVLLRNKLAEINFPLVISFISERYLNNYEENAVYDVDDIVQEGCLILLDAIERYEPSRAKFSPFLYFQLKGRLFYKNTIPNSPVHFTFGKTSKFRKVKKYMDLGYDDLYISEKCEIKPSIVKKLRIFFEGQESYEQLINNQEDFITFMEQSNNEWADLYLGRIIEQPVIEKRNRLLLEALNSLSERDKKLIVKKYGLDGNAPVGFKEIKDMFGYKGSLAYERRRVILKKLAKCLELEQAFLEVDSDYDHLINVKTYYLQK